MPAVEFEQLKAMVGRARCRSLWSMVDSTFTPGIPFTIGRPVLFA